MDWVRLSAMTTAAELDRVDPLARFRSEFHLPEDQIYLDGNSLGLLSRRAEVSLLNALEQWRKLGIGGWTDAPLPWLTLAESVSEKIAPLLGAAPDEICITGQTTANLHQVLATLFNPEHATRKAIVGDALNFASDTYALRSHLRLRGLSPEEWLRLIPSRDGRTLNVEDIVSSFKSDVQIAMLPSVLFTSGQLLDIPMLTREAHANGVLLGFDCSHSIGVVPHFLDGDGVDFAVWGNYKWLNAGPGAPGGIYLNRRHFGCEPGLAGWWGVKAERRFAMPKFHERSAGAAALHIGTPHILSLAPLLGSLEMIAEAAGIAALREKSLLQTGFLMTLIDAELASLGFTIVNPRDAAARGGHVALAHPDGWRICQALRAARVVPDFRQPDLIRLAPSPLYTSFADCAEAISRLKQIMVTLAYRLFPPAPALVP
jgi:kynureninase